MDVIIRVLLLVTMTFVQTSLGDHEECLEIYYRASRVQSANDGFCWYFFNGNFTVGQAKSLCQLHEGQLPAINSYSKAGTLASFASSVRQLYFNGSFDHSWLPYYAAGWQGVTLWGDTVTEQGGQNGQVAQMVWNVTQANVSYQGFNESTDKVTSGSSCTVFDMTTAMWRFSTCQGVHTVVCEEEGHHYEQEDPDETQNVTKAITTPQTPSEGGNGTSGNGTNGNGSSGDGTNGDGTSGNGTSGNGTSGDGTSGNGTSGDGTSGNGTSGNGTNGNGTSGDGTSGNGTSGDGTSGNGTSGNGTSGNGTSGNGTSGNGTSGDGTSGDGNSDNGTSGDGTSGNGTSGNGTNGNGTSGDGTSGNGSNGNGTNGNGTSGNGTNGNGTSGDGTSGDGTSDNGTNGNGTSGDGTNGNGTSGDGTNGNGPSGDGTSGNGPSGNGTNTTPTQAWTCPAKFSMQGGRCFATIGHVAGVFLANEYCKTSGSHLAVVLNATDEETVADYLRGRLIQWKYFLSPIVYTSNNTFIWQSTGQSAAYVANKFKLMAIQALLFDTLLVVEPSGGIVTCHRCKCNARALCQADVKVYDLTKQFN